MLEIKQQIISRIDDIRDLEKLVSAQTKSRNYKLEVILRQESKEQYRCNREAYLLSIANISQFNLSQLETYSTVYDICVHYDEKIANGQSYPVQGLKEKTYKLLRTFFTEHDYKEKVTYLKTVCSRNFSPMLSCLLLTLLSEWSKKKYLKVLSIVVKQAKQAEDRSKIPKYQKKANFFKEDHTNLNIKVNKSALTSEKSLRSFRSDAANNVYHNIIEGGHGDMKKQTSPRQRTTSLSTALPNLSKNDKSRASSGAILNSKLLTIYNKATLYGYMLEQLEEYYNLTGIQELDKCYLKMVPRKRNKENILLRENLNRSTEVLIDCSTNKELKKKIKLYCEYINQYKEGLIRQKLKKLEEKRMKLEQKKRKAQLEAIAHHHSTRGSPSKETKMSKGRNLRTMSDSLIDVEKDIDTRGQEERNSCEKSNGSSRTEKKKFSIQIKFNDPKKDKTSVTIEIPNNFNSSLLSIPDQKQMKDFHSNHYKMAGNEEEEEQGRKDKKMNKINFPSLTRSMEKGQKAEKQLITIKSRFQTEENDDIHEMTENDRISSLKFTQRQTIRGIIVKNFLSNREKIIKKAIAKQLQQQQQLQNEKQQRNQSQPKLSKLQLSTRNISGVDIKSLRQKTKALLRNFKTIQNY